MYTILSLSLGFGPWLASESVTLLGGGEKTSRDEAGGPDGAFQGLSRAPGQEMPMFLVFSSPKTHYTPPPDVLITPCKSCRAPPLDDVLDPERLSKIPDPDHRCCVSSLFSDFSSSPNESQNRPGLSLLKTEVMLQPDIQVATVPRFLLCKCANLGNQAYLRSRKTAQRKGKPSPSKSAMKYAAGRDPNVLWNRILFD